MAIRVLNESQIIDIIWGATLLGGGGGGSMKNGIELLEKYKKDHPGKPIKIELYETKDLDPLSYAAVTAGMGAPKAIKDVDFSVYATNAYNALCEYAEKLEPKRYIKYSLAVEMGGFNTFVPMLISLVQGMPFIDADGAGRAVPALNTLLLHINGLDTSPLAMANGNNDKITIELSNKKNAELAEEIGRHICIAFGMLSGLSGWMVRKDEIEENLPCGTVSLAEKIGKVLRNTEAKDKFSELRKIGLGCREFCKGVVTKVETITKDGFDYGKVYISDLNTPNVEWIIYFQNENLLVTRNGQPIMTVPDIICTYEYQSGIPLTNADIEEKMKVSLGALKVDQMWEKNPNMFDMWKPFLKRVGYEGERMPFKY
jgi:DUF917 family protein